MKYRVLKFPLEFGRTEINVPIGSKVVHVHEQNERPTVWVQVQVSPYADHNPSKMAFEVVGTGQEFDFDGTRKPTHPKHVGTAHIGWTVWHVYEVHPW